MTIRKRCRLRAISPARGRGRLVVRDKPRLETVASKLMGAFARGLAKRKEQTDG